MAIGGCIDAYIELIELPKPAFKFRRGGDNDGICMWWWWFAEPVEPKIPLCKSLSCVSTVDGDDWTTPARLLLPPVPHPGGVVVAGAATVADAAPPRLGPVTATVVPPPLLPVFGVRLWLRIFSSRRHFARRFENHTYTLVVHFIYDKICMGFVLVFFIFLYGFYCVRNRTRHHSHRNLPEYVPRANRFWPPAVPVRIRPDNGCARIPFLSYLFDRL